uniref:Uncharacterized protein n=1 Tax=Arundo donax TaxID=35708 RepID=A0A0A8YRA2_ARUDO
MFQINLCNFQYLAFCSPDMPENSMRRS